MVGVYVLFRLTDRSSPKPRNTENVVAGPGRRLLDRREKASPLYFFHPICITIFKHDLRLVNKIIHPVCCFHRVNTTTNHVTLSGVQRLSQICNTFMRVSTYFTRTDHSFVGTTGEDGMNVYPTFIER